MIFILNSNLFNMVLKLVMVKGYGFQSLSLHTREKRHDIHIKLKSYKLKAFRRVDCLSYLFLRGIKSNKHCKEVQWFYTLKINIYTYSTG